MSAPPDRPAAVALLFVLLAAATSPSLAARPAGDRPAVSLPGLQTAVPDTLTLAEAVRTALERSPAMTEARAQVSEREAARWADWGALVPEVDAGAGFDRTDATRLTFQGEEGRSERSAEPLEFVRTSSSQTLTLSWTVLDGGRRLAEIDAGAARADASRHRLAAEERAIRAEVRRAYFDALEKRRLVRLTRRQLEARRRELEVARQRLRAGSGTRVDLLGAKVEVDEARMRLLDARDRSERARRELRQEMGLGGRLTADRRPLAPVDSLPPVARLDAGELTERARRRDPRLQAHEADAEAAASSDLAGWTEYLPEITAEYDLSRAQSGGPEDPFINLDPSDRFSTVSLQLSWSVFGGFDRRERRATAAANRRRAEASRRRRELELERRIGNLVAELRRRSRRMEMLREKLEHARERLALARESYEEGIRSFDEFQPFIDEARAAERSLLEERYDLLTAWASLEEVAGDPGATASR